MNILIYDYSALPDLLYQHRVRQLFDSLPDTNVRFVNGILDSAWYIHHFRPDAIVLDWIGDCESIKRLVTTLHRIKPGVAMFHLDGDGFTVTTSPCGLLADAAVPQWLHGIASDWILARSAYVPAM
jgi:hypothetical protein